MTRTAAESYRERDARIRRLEAEIMQEKMLQDLDWTRMSPEEREAAEADLGPSRQTIADLVEKKAWVRKGPPPEITFHDVAADPSFPLGAKLGLMESELKKDLDESARRLDEAFAKAEAAAREKGEDVREIRKKRLEHRRARPEAFEDLQELSEHLSGNGAWLGEDDNALLADLSPEQRRKAEARLRELPEDEGPWRCCMHGKFRPGRCPRCFSHIRR